MTDLIDLVEAYKREVSIPGAFAIDFPTVQDDQIAASLGDAFGEAQLAGFFSTMSLDTDDWSITPDLSTAGAALIVIYAGLRVVRQQLKNASASTTYRAGTTEYSKTQAISLLTEIVKELKERLDRIVANARSGSGTSVFVLDGYARRGNAFYGGLFDYETALPRWNL